MIWRTDNPYPSSAAQQEQVYNGLDCCVTLEVLEALLPQLNEITGPVYDFELALQAPILEMELRGIRVDQFTREMVRREYIREHDRVLAHFDRILSDGLGITPINPGSWQQKQYLLYDVLGLPPVRKWGSTTTDRGALEKLSSYFQAEPICRHIMVLQDLRKKLGFLKTGIGSDGRMRTSFNIAGTDTGRLSSYESAWFDGTNLQNIAPEMRRMFVADPGMKMAYIDLEQAEARAVGAIIWNLFHDGTYLDFCESGDLHTNVVKMTWQELPWTGDKYADRKIAEQPFYRTFNYRDAAKRLGHASNYRGQPPHISKEVRIPVGLVQEFQRNYFKTFPGIPKYHEWVRTKLNRDGWITTFLGRQRWFFGRRWEDETIRAAVAYEPQSTIADYLNRGMLRVWEANCCQLLAQVHDAILIQYPEDKESEVVTAVQGMLEIVVPLMHGRTLKIPTEATVGWNWGYKSGDNPDGLSAFGNDTRKRTQVSLMDRVLSRTD